jgi:hypothetical protein
MRQGYARLGALIVLLAIQGCAAAPSTAASPDQNPQAAPTATTIQPTGTPTSAEPTSTASPPAGLTPAPVPMTRIPNGPTPSPASPNVPAADNTAVVPPPPTDQTVAGAAISPQQLPAVTLVKADLAKRTNQPSSAIAVTSVSAAVWPDSSLGCPQPGFMYSQIVTPGYRIVLSAGGQTYEYHTGRGTSLTLCTPAQVK